MCILLLKLILFSYYVIKGEKCTSRAATLPYQLHIQVLRYYHHVF